VAACGFRRLPVVLVASFVSSSVDKRRWFLELERVMVLVLLDFLTVDASISSSIKGV